MKRRAELGLRLNHHNRNGVSPGKKNEPRGQWGELFSLIKSVAIFLAIAFLLRASVVEAFKIPSSSMEPTLQIGDHILVNKLSYGLRIPIKKSTIVQFQNPDRGDIVVFTRPDDPLTPEEDESDTNIIKRVVGLPGETIEVRGTRVYINGEPYEEEGKHLVWWELGGRKEFPATVVPEGKVFLLGDNRDHSRDSRYWQDPFLEIQRIKGRAFVIYWNSLFQLKRIFNIIR